MSTADQVSALVAPLLADIGTELVDVELTGGTLRVTIDRPGGVDMEAIAEVTRRASRALDEHDPLPGSYTLEVTSPGLERPLRRADHFARAVGQRVKVKTVAGTEGDRRLDGTITAAGSDSFTIQPGDGGAERTLRYEQVERARTVFEWGPPPKPGRGSKPGARRSSARTKAGAGAPTGSPMRKKAVS